MLEGDRIKDTGYEGKMRLYDMELRLGDTKSSKK